MYIHIMLQKANYMTASLYATLDIYGIFTRFLRGRERTK